MIIYHLKLYIMEKINKNYQVWLHWSITSSCPLRCEYCFVNSVRPTKKYIIPSLFKMLGLKRTHDPRRDNPKSVDINSVINSLELLGKTCLIGLSGGGEPFAVPNFIELCEALIKDHYILINTNFVYKSVLRFVDRIDPGRVEVIVVSYHYQELIRKNLIDIFFRNLNYAKEKGFNIVVAMPAYPSYVKDISKHRKLIRSKGFEFIYQPFCGWYKGKLYPDNYSENELRVFSLSDEKVATYNRLGKLCNAGYNAATIQDDGTINSCSSINDNLGDIMKKVNLRNELTICPVGNCGCPLSELNKNLYNIALRECGYYE